MALVVINDTLHSTPAAFRFTDNRALGVVDSIEEILATKTSCSTPEASYSRPGSVVEGDLVVVDAHPGPTSKDQRTYGGFASVGFRNQGQCVASVNRGPKP